MSYGLKSGVVRDPLVPEAEIADGNRLLQQNPPEADTSTERSGQWHRMKFAACALPSAQEPVTLCAGQTRHISDALKPIPEVWCTADTDVRSPREYHARTCSGGHRMFLAAAQHLPSVRHSVNRRRRRRLLGSIPLLHGDSDVALEHSDAAEPSTRRALLPPQASRSRQGQAPIR